MKSDKDWALVTGASGGIGREFARLLAKAGWGLVLVGRSGVKLEATRASLEGPRAAEALVLRADLAEPGAAARLHAELSGRGLSVGLLVNNAGSGLFGESVTLDPTALESMLALNVSALTGLSALFGRDMAARGRGAILNVGSFAGLKPLPFFAAYSASKSYVLSFSLALRAELAGSGVAVSCLLPGYVRTDFDENAGIASATYRAFSSRNAMDAEDAAKAGLALLERGRAWGIAGARNRIAALLMGLLPAAAAPRIVKPFLERLARKEP